MTLAEIFRTTSIAHNYLWSGKPYSTDNHQQSLLLQTAVIGLQGTADLRYRTYYWEIGVYPQFHVCMCVWETFK